MKTYVVTGAAGHLGGTLMRKIEERGFAARGLILPNESGADRGGIRYFRGDVRDPKVLNLLFEGLRGEDVVCVHAAGIVDITGALFPALYDVNVGGTRAVTALCLEKNVSRMVYVSSVHALPEIDALSVSREIDAFSPDLVHGGYAKTKAEATQSVLDAARAGLNAVIVHPSGIIGPNDPGRNHLVQLIWDYMSGRLPACVRGGYDFVDVRDVAEGCLLAAEKGRAGQCYILSGARYAVRDVLEMVRRAAGGRKAPALPMWVARAGVPTIALIAKLRGTRPLYTRYALSALTSFDRFSHDKATRELGYSPRDLASTIADTVSYLRAHPPVEVPT